MQACFFAARLRRRLMERSVASRFERGTHSELRRTASARAKRAVSAAAGSGARAEACFLIQQAIPELARADTADAHAALVAATGALAFFAAYADDSSRAVAYLELQTAQEAVELARAAKARALMRLEAALVLALAATREELTATR